jgi:hypothetical protein
VKALFLRKENVPEKVESVPNGTVENAFHILRERFLFLKKGLSLLWNAFSSVPIWNGVERVPLFSGK